MDTQARNPGTILASELGTLLEKGDVLALLDVREPDEREFCAIAVPLGIPDLHVPMSVLVDHLDRIRALKVPIVVYCHHGVRSRMAAQWLATQGVGRLLNLEGGIDAWSLRVAPEVPRY